MNRRTTALLIFGAAALTLLAACTPAKTAAPPDTTAAAQISPDEGQDLPPIESPDESEAVVIPIEPDHEDPWTGWSDDMSLRHIKPLDVDLAAETQWQIYSVCRYDNADFALLMAIGQHETGLDPYALGDEGGSIGIFQINVKWHLDRMDRLDVTDLQDPAQCAAVALDYIKELEDRYGFPAYSHALLMAYNMGPGGATTALEAGTTATNYSREVMELYQGFLNELEGGQ